MRGVARIATLSMLVALVPATAASAAEDPPQLSAVIVQLDRGGPAPEQVAADIVGRFGGRSGIVYRYAISGFFAELPAAAIEALGNNPNVISVTPDRVVTVAVQETPTGFDRTESDLVPRAAVPLDTSCPAGETCTDVDIAILDTGVNAHADLNVVARTDCSTISFFSLSCSDG